jgi:hypothetical protein
MLLWNRVGLLRQAGHHRPLFKGSSVGAFAQLKLRGAERGLRWRTEGECVAHALCRFYGCGGHVLAPHADIASNLLIGIGEQNR